MTTEFSIYLPTATCTHQRQVPATSAPTAASRTLSVFPAPLAAPASNCMQNQPLHSISETSLCFSSALSAIHAYAASSCRQIQLPSLEGLCTVLHSITLHCKRVPEGQKTWSGSDTCSEQHSHEEEQDLNNVCLPPQGTMEAWTEKLSAKGFNWENPFARAELFLCYLTISWTKEIHPSLST